MIVGYARTSTTDQVAGLAAQERDLKSAGAERIFGEQVSSAAKRARLAECLAFLRDGHVLTVTEPDRMARDFEVRQTLTLPQPCRGLVVLVGRPGAAPGAPLAAYFAVSGLPD